MKKWIIGCLIAAISVFAAGCGSTPSAGDKAGQQHMAQAAPDAMKASDLQLKTLDGKTAVSLKELYKDRPVYLNFWASWCPPCVREMPHIEALQKQYGDKIYFAAVTMDQNPADARAFIQDKGLTLPVYTGNLQAIAQLYDVSAIPVSLLIGTDGTILAKHVGAMDEAELKQFLQPAL